MIHEVIKFVSMFFVIAGACLVISPGADMPVMKRLNNLGNSLLSAGLLGIIISFLFFWLEEAPFG